MVIGCVLGYRLCSQLWAVLMDMGYARLCLAVLAMLGYAGYAWLHYAMLGCEDRYCGGGCGYGYC